MSENEWKSTGWNGRVWRLWRVWRLGMLCLMTCVVVGCSPPQPVDFHVTGTVTYQGKPVPAGIVFFDPDPLKKNDGPQGFATIKEGKFDTRESKRGVAGGPYVARILGFDGQPAFELPYGQPIFREYQTSIELPQQDTTQNFDVPEKPAGR